MLQLLTFSCFVVKGDKVKKKVIRTAVENIKRLMRRSSVPLDASEKIRMGNPGVNDDSPN